MTDPPSHLFCFGLGYSALTLARRLQALGWRVSGTVRHAEKARSLAAEGLEMHLFDGSAPIADLSEAFASVTHLLVSVPPGETGDPVLIHHGPALQAIRGRFAWAGYLSTTGVYGDRAGGFVDEESTLQPTGVRGRRRVAAEAAWRATGLPLHIFRLAGIYGPGRNALRNVLDGSAKRVDRPGQVFSRIHVEDIATVLEASIARPHPGRVYNVCDDDPMNPAEVVIYAAALLGRDPPPLRPLAEAGLSAMGMSFYDDSKRVTNARIKTELGVKLAFPSYRDGLKALLAGERAGD